MSGEYLNSYLGRNRMKVTIKTTTKVGSLTVVKKLELDDLERGRKIGYDYGLHSVTIKIKRQGEIEITS